MSVGEEAETIEEVYEPYLIQEGFIERTPRGRMATDRAYQHFGIQKGFQKGPQKGLQNPGSEHLLFDDE